MGLFCRLLPSIVGLVVHSDLLCFFAVHQLGHEYDGALPKAKIVFRGQWGILLIRCVVA